MKKLRIIMLVLIMCLCGCGIKASTKQGDVLSAENPEGRIVITLDTWQKSVTDLDQEVMAFNQSNSKYFVRMITYEDMEREDFLTARSVKILTGRGADIYVLNGDKRFKAYIEKGVLEKLDTYIEADIRKEEYVDNVFDIYRYNDATYAVPGYFAINLLIGSKDMFPNEASVSFEELCEVVEREKPESIMGRSPMVTLWWLYNTFSLDVTNPEQLRKGIELAKEYCYKRPSERDTKFAGLGKETVLMDTMVSATTWMVHEKATFGTYGEDFVAVNRPYLSGLTLGINHASEEKEGAWEFIRFVLSEERQRERAFGQKVCKSVFMEELLEESAYVEEFYSVPKEKVEQEFLQMVEDCIRSGKADLLCRDYDAWLILSEEVQAYYDGMRGLDETIDMIQNRLNLYYME